MLFKGSAVALVTPFTKDNKVDFDKLGELVEYQIANGTDAIVSCGTTGEANTMTDEEQLATIKYVVEKVNKRVPVIAGSGSNDTMHSVNLSQEAEKLGANPDDICKEAIYGFGKMRGQKYNVADTPGKMAEMLYNSKGQKVFEMELVENTDENGVLKFHHCPLDAAWKEYGLTKEERKEICRLACYGDYGRVDCAQGVKLDFAQKCAHDDEVCELVFTKK